MRQVELSVHGGPEVLRVVDAAPPLPSPVEALIAVHAAGVTFLDTQLRAGRSPLPGPPPVLPLVLGGAVEGRVMTSSSDPHGAGRAVVSVTAGRGGYAEAALVRRADLHLLDGRLAPGVAVAVLTDGRTALALLRAAQLQPGERVLVMAGAGGVGTLIRQLARGAGAAGVVGAVGSVAKVEAVQADGDDAVLYVADGWLQRAGAVDVVFDGVGGLLGTAAASLLPPGGRFLPFGAASGRPADVGAARERGVSVLPGWGLIASADDRRGLERQALALAAEQVIRPRIGRRAGLDEAADVHADIEARRLLGKSVLVP